MNKKPVLTVKEFWEFIDKYDYDTEIVYKLDSVNGDRLDNADVIDNADKLVVDKLIPSYSFEMGDKSVIINITMQVICHKMTEDDSDQRLV